LEIWAQDEARIGQQGRAGHLWFERGQRARAPRDTGRESAWIVGAVCPERDTGVALVMTRADTAVMNRFLVELGAAVSPGAHAVVLMDGAGWHIGDDLVVPKNLKPVFLPAYSPELNPIERVWLHIRDTWIGHRVFADLNEVIDVCCEVWNRLLADAGRIRSLCSYPWTTAAVNA
jgi:DDE superfamily endonuclease